MSAFISGNMMGRVKVVGPRIQSQFPKAVPFWCTAHRLNRCIVAAPNIQMVHNIMGFADKVICFIKLFHLLQLNKTRLKRFLEEGQIVCFNSLT